MNGRLELMWFNLEGCDMIKGYICRSRVDKRISNHIIICEGRKLPSQRKDGWFWYVPGWFCSMSVRKFKKDFGFSIKPGTYKRISISISEDKQILTKKDFKAVAETIRAERDFVLELEPDDCRDVNPKIAALGTVDEIVRKLADYFAMQNPHFDRKRFLTACGLGGK